MNNNKEFESACGKTNRIVTARILPGVDLLDGIEKICKKHQIKYGYIAAAVGSFKKVAFKYVSRLYNKLGEGHATFIEIEGPHDMLSGQGIIAASLDGKNIDIHFHAVLTDRLDRACGGHIKPGTIILSTVDIVIIEMLGIKAIREIDPKTGIVFSSFEEIPCD